MKYPNIYNRVKKDDTYNSENSDELGFVTTGTSKPAILSALSRALNTYALRVPSDAIKTELKRYPRKESDLIHSEEETGHWDRVMALAIAWEARSQVGNINN